VYSDYMGNPPELSLLYIVLAGSASVSSSFFDNLSDTLHRRDLNVRLDGLNEEKLVNSG